MSSVNTTLLETDKIVAKDGDETKEVQIPSFMPKTLAAFCEYSATIGDGKINDSFNVSSISKVSTGQHDLNLIKPMKKDKFATVATSLVNNAPGAIRAYPLNKNKVRVLTSKSNYDMSFEDAVGVSVLVAGTRDI